MPVHGLNNRVLLATTLIGQQLLKASWLKERLLTEATLTGCGWARQNRNAVCLYTVTFKSNHLELILLQGSQTAGQLNNNVMTRNNNVMATFLVQKWLNDVTIFSVQLYFYLVKKGLNAQKYSIYM